MRRAIMLLLVTMLLYLCSCSASLTFSPISAADAEHDRPHAGAEDQTLPTPQFIMVDTDIEPGRIVSIRLRQHPDWKARQRSLQPVNVITTPTVSGGSNAEADRVLGAINAAFKRAQTVSESPRQTLVPPAQQLTPQARLEPLQATR